MKWLDWLRGEGRVPPVDGKGAVVIRTNGLPDGYVPPSGSLKPPPGPLEARPREGHEDAGHR